MGPQVVSDSSPGDVKAPTSGASTVIQNSESKKNELNRMNILSRSLQKVSFQAQIFPAFSQISPVSHNQPVSTNVLPKIQNKDLDALVNSVPASARQSVKRPQLVKKVNGLQTHKQQRKTSRKANLLQIPPVFCLQDNRVGTAFEKEGVTNSSSQKIKESGEKNDLAAVEIQGQDHVGYVQQSNKMNEMTVPPLPASSPDPSSSPEPLTSLKKSNSRVIRIKNTSKNYLDTSYHPDIAPGVPTMGTPSSSYSSKLEHREQMGQNWAAFSSNKANLTSIFVRKSGKKGNRGKNKGNFTNLEPFETLFSSTRPYKVQKGASVIAVEGQKIGQISGKGQVSKEISKVANGYQNHQKRLISDRKSMGQIALKTRNNLKDMVLSPKTAIESAKRAFKKDNYKTARKNLQNQRDSLPSINRDLLPMTPPSTVNMPQTTRPQTDKTEHRGTLTHDFQSQQQSRNPQLQDLKSIPSESCDVNTQRASSKQDKTPQGSLGRSRGREEGSHKILSSGDAGATSSVFDPKKQMRDGKKHLYPKKTKNFIAKNKMLSSTIDWGYSSFYLDNGANMHFSTNTLQPIEYIKQVSLEAHRGQKEPELKQHIRRSIGTTAIPKRITISLQRKNEEDEINHASKPIDRVSLHAKLSQRQKRSLALLTKSNNFSSMHISLVKQQHHHIDAPTTPTLPSSVTTKVNHWQRSQVLPNNILSGSLSGWGTASAVQLGNHY